MEKNKESVKFELSEEELKRMIQEALHPPKDPDERVKAREVLLKIKGFTYHTDKDVEDCVECFLSVWFKNFKKAPEDVDKDYITYILADLSKRDEQDIILDENLMKMFYEHHMAAYNMGAHQQKEILKAWFLKGCHKGVLKTFEGWEKF